jgi:hypothetical protein
MPARILRYRFTFLLAALSLLLIAAPMILLFLPKGDPLLRDAILTAVFLAVVMTAVAALSATRINRRTAMAIGGLAILLQIINTAAHDDVSFALYHILRVVFLGFAIIVAVRILFLTTRVDLDTISASLCVYLMLGVFWASLYLLVDRFEEGAFAGRLTAEMEVEETSGGVPGAENAIAVKSIVGSPPETATATSEDDTRKTHNMLYFSYVTLSTLGYGDIVPTSPVASMLAVAEAMVGQAFLVVLVARVVGLHISQPREEPRPRDEDEQQPGDD